MAVAAAEQVQHLPGTAAAIVLWADVPRVRS